MKARATNITSVAECIKTHPGLNDKQKDELLEKYRNFTDETCTKIIGLRMKQMNKEMAAMTLMILHLHVGYGRKRLERFAKNFTETWNAVAEKLADTGIMTCEGAYHDLKSLYPECDKWLGVDEDDNE